MITRNVFAGGVVVLAGTRDVNIVSAQNTMERIWRSPSWTLCKDAASVISVPGR